MAESAVSLYWHETYILALQASTSKTPYPAGVSAIAPSPHQYPSYLCNMSPHPNAAAVTVSTLAEVQQQHDSSQQHAQQAATASQSAADAHQFEAQWEDESMNTAQTASRLSLLQAEHTQVELELAEAAQQTAAGRAGPGMSHHWQQEAAMAPAAAAEDAVSHHPSETLPVELIEQQEQPVTSSGKSEGQCEVAAAMVTHSEPARPAQSHRPGSRRLTRSSACASCASQSSESDAVSTAKGGRRGKRQTQAVTNLPAVTEQSEADLAADPAVSTAEMHDQQALVSQAASEAAVDREADPSGSQQQTALVLALVPKEEDLMAASADLTAPDGGLQHTNVSACDSLHKGEAELPSVSGAQAAALAALQEAAIETQQEEPAKHHVRVHASDAAQSTAPGSADPEASVATPTCAAAAVEATEKLHGRENSAAEGASHAAESQQELKGRGRVKRPPKPRQPAKKKHNRKQGRLPPKHDENADVNKVFASQHGHVRHSDVAAATEQKIDDVAMARPASSLLQATCQEKVETKDGSGAAGKREGRTKPTR